MVEVEQSLKDGGTKIPVEMEKYLKEKLDKFRKKDKKKYPGFVDQNLDGSSLNILPYSSGHDGGKSLPVGQR